MPEVSRFFGIIIKMFFNDHAPPHFHVQYGDYKAVIDINTKEVTEGYLPPKQLRLVQAWAFIHEQELMDNFKVLANNNPNLKMIEPLR